MSSFLTIKKTGFFSQQWDKRAGIFVEAPTKHILSELRNEIELEADLTLGDLMRLVRGNKELTNFLRQYSWCSDIDEWHKQLDRPIKEHEKADCEFAEVYWAARYNTSSKLFFIKSGLHGVNSGSTGYNYTCLGGCLLNSIMHLRLVLNEDMPLYKTFAGGKFVYEQEFKRRFTLLDVLDTVYWDISYYCTAADAEAYYPYEFEEVTSNNVHV